MEGKYKSLLLINDSTDARVTINFYKNWDIICWIPHASNVINPGDTFSYSCKKGLKIELIARFEDRKQPTKRILSKPQQWIEDKFVRITDSFDLVERNLTPEEKEACLRKKRRDKELKLLDGGCNLYNILRLDMKEVRAMPKEEQDEEITRAFQREIQIWHRDCNPDGDDDIVREVIMAYDILRDREKRARYNNMADYDSGWLSGKRFKAVFWPERETVGQRLAWIKRMALLGLSVGLTLVGILSVVLTAGFSTPLIASVVVGGVHALQQTISREAVLDGCDVKKWLMATGIGYFLAFLPGGAAIGVAALESTALISVAEIMGIRSAIAAGCAVVSSLGSDAKKAFIDGEDITVKMAIGHAACQAAAAASAALAGGAVAKAMHTGTQSAQTATGKAMADLSTTKTQAAASTVEVAIDKPLSPTLPDQAKRLARGFPVRSTEIVTRGAIQKVAEFAEKNLGGSAKNPSPGENNVHLQDRAPKEIDAVLNAIETGQPPGIITYISTGYWFSKMVVSYVVNEEKITQEKRGNGRRIKIPSNAERIKVSFKVLRPPWCDVSKYDRFKKCWCEPREPHIFHYESPPTRTFTVSGPLYWEAVMAVTDEHSNETKEM